MAFHLKPKEEKFFNLLDKHAALCYAAADILKESVNEEISKAEAMEKINALEEEANDLVLETMKRLQKSFITPMDREDIQELIDKLDKALDNVTEIMDKMCIYRVGTATEGTKRMATIMAKSMKEIRRSIEAMRNVKKEYLKIEARSKKIMKLEQECDDLYHEEMGKLFAECKDPIELIKWKEILQSIEDVTDGCESLATLFRRIVLKYA